MPGTSGTGKLLGADETARLAELIGIPYGKWSHRCHEISLALVRTGLFGQPGEDVQVARGFARGVRGQHSWIIQGGPFAADSVITDPTLWSYDSMVSGIWTGPNLTRHWPHGLGSVFASEYPHPVTSDYIELEGHGKLSQEAKSFLEIFGPLDQHGWGVLAHAPVGGWPAGEIFAAMAATPGLGVLIPVDRLGMTTKLNPGNAYW